MGRVQGLPATGVAGLSSSCHRCMEAANLEQNLNALLMEPPNHLLQLLGGGVRALPGGHGGVWRKEADGGAPHWPEALC